MLHANGSMNAEFSCSSVYDGMGFCADDKIWNYVGFMKMNKAAQLWMLILTPIVRWMKRQGVDKWKNFRFICVLYRLEWMTIVFFFLDKYLYYYIELLSKCMKSKMRKLLENSRYWCDMFYIYAHVTFLDSNDMIFE